MTSLNEALRQRCVEPRKRNKDGERWIVHRFPIKGGISLGDVMLLEAARPNPFLKYLKVAKQ